MIQFHSTGVYTMDGRGRVYTVALDREVEDFEWLYGKEVLIDGRFFRVKGVERFAHAPPWRKGEPIGLLVDSRFDGVTQAQLNFPYGSSK